MNGVYDMCPAPIIPNKIFTYPHLTKNFVGKWPRYHNGEAENGGLPQLSDSAAHKQAVAEYSDGTLPEDYTGLVCLDFESFYPVAKWNEEWPEGKAYNDKSLALAGKQMPGAPAEVIKIKAKNDFEYSIMQMLVAAVDGVKMVRPNAKVGFYNYPRRKYHGGYDGGINDLTTGNDLLAPLWQRIDVLMPSLYLFYKDDSAAAHVAAKTLAECHRIKADYNNKLLIYPYTMLRYHDSSSVGGQFLTENDLSVELLLPFDHGADGVILWGNCPNLASALDFSSYLAGKVIPMLDEFYGFA